MNSQQEFCNREYLKNLGKVFWGHELNGYMCDALRIPRFAQDKNASHMNIYGFKLSRSQNWTLSTSTAVTSFGVQMTILVKFPL